MEITGRLRALREERGLNQTEIAEVLKIQQTVYSRYERGAREIPLRHLAVLAEFYGTSADYLMDLTDEKKPYPRK